MKSRTKSVVKSAKKKDNGKKTGSKAEKKKSKAVSSDIVEGKTVNSCESGRDIPDSADKVAMEPDSDHFDPLSKEESVNNNTVADLGGAIGAMAPLAMILRYLPTLTLTIKFCTT